jgi:hypothetical protein
METFKYSDLLLRLEGFDAWLTKLGLTPRPNDRIHEAFKILRKAEEASRKGRETGAYIDIQPKDWFPIIEALEAHDVFTAFKNDPSPAIGAALKRAMSGPIQPIDESPKNRDGRNIWFELALAAEWRLRGASVIVEEPDLRLTRDNISFLVACKRPAKEQSIHANILDAIEQLQQNLDKTPQGAFGVAAISLGCVFNPGDKVFSGEVNALGDLLANQLDKHSRYLRSVDDPRICCVMFHIATPSVGPERVDLLRASYSVAQELKHPSIGSKTFREHALDMRSSPKILKTPGLEVPIGR